MAPGDRALERPLARRRVARPAARQRQAGRQPVADDRRRQERRRGPRRARSRAAGRRAGDRSRRRRRRRRRGSQPGRTARARSMNRAGRVVDQRRDRELVLAGDAERRAARHDDRDSSARRARRRRPRPPPPAGARSCRGRGASTGRPGTTGSGRCRRPLGAVEQPDRRGRSPPGPASGSVDVGEAARTTPRPEPRLERAGRASIARLVLPMPPGPVSVTSRASRDQRPRARRAPRRGRRTSSADRAGCRSARPRSGAAGSRSAGPAMSSWLRRSARGTSLSTWRPRSRRRGPGGQRVGDEGRRRLGQDDLAAVPDGGDPSRAVDVEAAVVVAARMGLAGVQAHPDADRDAVRPGLGRERPLRVDGGARPRRRPPGRPRRARRPRSGRSTPPCASTASRMQRRDVPR